MRVIEKTLSRHYDEITFIIVDASCGKSSEKVDTFNELCCVAFLSEMWKKEETLWVRHAFSPKKTAPTA